MLRFVDMQAAGIAGVRFGFWDTVTDAMLSFDGDQGWDTFDELSESARAAGKARMLPRLSGLCPSWVHSSETMIGAVADALHRLGARTIVGGDLRLCDPEHIDGAVYDTLHALIDEAEDTPRELLLARLAAAMLAELGDEWAARASADEDEPAPKTCRHGGVYRGERCGVCGEMVG